MFLSNSQIDTVTAHQSARDLSVVAAIVSDSMPDSMSIVSVAAQRCISVASIIASRSMLDSIGIVSQ